MELSESREADGTGGSGGQVTDGPYPVSLIPTLVPAHASGLFFPVRLAHVPR